MTTTKMRICIRDRGQGMNMAGLTESFDEEDHRADQTRKELRTIMKDIRPTKITALTDEVKAIVDTQSHILHTNVRGKTRKKEVQATVATKASTSSANDKEKNTEKNMRGTTAVVKKHAIDLHQL